MTLLYTDPLFLEHATGQHPENPKNVAQSHAALEAANLIGRCRAGTFKPAEKESILAVHEPQVFELAKAMAEHGGGYLDPDTVVCPASFRVSLNAAGACIAAVDAVLAGVDKTASSASSARQGIMLRPTRDGLLPLQQHRRGGRSCSDRNMPSSRPDRRLGRAPRQRHSGRLLLRPGRYFLEHPPLWHGFYPAPAPRMRRVGERGWGSRRKCPLHYGISRKEYLRLFCRALSAPRAR